MPAVQYPFIDIAVHERVRDHFARGEAMVLFSQDLETALWANGRGASLFGIPMIYDFLDQGPKRTDVTFRQLTAAAARLMKAGDNQQFTIRIHSGFKSIPVVATVEIIEVEPGQTALLFSTPTDPAPPSIEECARRMIEGFDDPDIHLAVLVEKCAVIAASGAFATLDITQHTTKTLVSMAERQSGHLVKRPVPTGKGYLPAAVAQLSKSPELNLLFVVETVLGKLDPMEEFSPSGVVANVPVEEQPEAEATTEVAFSSNGFDAVIEAVASLEEPQITPELFDRENDWQPASDPIDLQDDFYVDIPDSVSENAEPDLAETVAEAISDDAEDIIVTENDEADVTEPESPAVLIEETTSAASENHEVTDDKNEVEAAVNAEQNTGFVFNAAARASRFVWKIDAKGRFSSISHEFADAVGPRAADVDGMGFSEVAQRFNLDPEGKIAELLGKRDTWSGKTIYWPVEGTSLVVPIDLAALPTYTRAREFDGFRGFGIVRLADAIEDPKAIGLSFNPHTMVMDEAEQVETADLADIDLVSAKPIAEVEEYTSEAVMSGSDHSDDIEDSNTSEAGLPESESDANGPRAYTPSMQEVPALEISATHNRRYSDKVVQLEDRRSRARDGLSPGEQAAFREIARQLTPSDFSAPENDFFLEKTEPAYEEPEAELPEQDVVQTDPVEATVVATSQIDEEDAFAPYLRKSENKAIEAPGQLEIDDGEPAVEEPGVSLITPRTRMTGTLTPQAIDMMPVALLVHSGDNLLHANPEFLRLTGYASVQELEEVGGLDALLQRQELESSPGHASGMVAVSAENDLIPVKARLQSVRWQGSTALMLALIPVIEATTIQPLVEAAAEQDNAVTTQVVTLRGEIEELHSILETATDGVVILSEEGDIRSLNRSASALFNYDNAEIESKPFVTLFAHESQKAILDYLSGLSNNGVASVLNDGREVIGREASGGFLPLFMTIGRLKSSNGFCAVIRDITQWKRTEEDLRNAKRAAETANAHKSDFLARVSHEIRTPLNAIIGFADMMATERFGPIGHPRYVEYANDIGRSGRHVLDIVNDLLDISKIEAGQMDIDFTAVPLNDSVAEAVSLVQPQANNQRVIIRTALSQSVPQIVADTRSIKQIVLNILSNAIRFTPSGGQIVVSTAYEANGSVVLRIRDTGIGMTRSELEQAMKPFRQVAASSSRARGDGTGLGLPLTKAMVDANRANFSINSAPNEGTLVEISFPPQRVLAN